MKYYLGPWVWKSSPVPAFNPPDGAIAGLDLASIPQQSIAGSNRGLGLFWTASASLSSEYSLIGDGDCRELPATSQMQAAFRSLAGYRPQGAKLVDLIRDCLMGGSDPEGNAGPLPLVPTAEGFIELWMPGHSRVHAERFVWGEGSHTSKLKQLIRRDFRNHWERDQDHARRVMDAWCEKYKADWQEFVPQDLLPHVLGRLPHQTTINENFNQADSTTLGPQLSWTEVRGDWMTESSKAGKSTGSTTDIARADSDLSSADHYAQVVLAGGSSGTYHGPACRIDGSGAVTAYFTVCDGTMYLSKIVAGSQTNMTTTSQTFTNTDTYKVQANGTTIKSFVNGGEILSTTDSAISSNLRCGLTQFDPASTGDLDNFQAADLAAAVTTNFLTLLGVGN